MGYYVEYGPPVNWQRFDGKLTEIWPKYRRLTAEGRENFRIGNPDGDIQGPHQFELSIVRGGARFN